MSEGISQHSISDLFGDTVDYLIPMYQRNYAWGEGEITQLIQDVLDEMPNVTSRRSQKPYYIGTLVVFHRVNNGGHPVYEVIDGQQRLTTLFLLASYLRHEAGLTLYSQLDWFTRPCVRFESRPNSSNSMLAAFEGRLSQNTSEQFHSAEYNREVINGYELIQRLVPKLCNEARASQKAFSQYLFNQVQIMRVQVPEDTDLNHYFEIMNNRGEQLEKHEVLKSRLMSKLDKVDYAVLHSVWESCANMERYVQMGFPKHQRERIFGAKDWNQLIPSNFDELGEILRSSSELGPDKALSLRQLIVRTEKIAADKTGDSASKDEAPERFTSVINFANFLLQVLRASTGEDIPLDDKRLITVFEENLLRKRDAKGQVKEFIYNLLKGKYLFDQYVLKREFTANDDRWSLKRLKWQSSNDSNDYINTFGAEDAESNLNQRALMLLSALHVSTPTMVYKHWLNGALRYLFGTRNVAGREYIKYLESMTQCFVYDRFLANGDGLDYYDIIYKRNAKQKVTKWSTIDLCKLTFGHISNNLVFNYLDYLLWLKYRKKDANVQTYEFSFRSSVEHFYPRNPKPGVDKLADDALNSFGNLCLISHSKNSTLSNLDPQAKKGHYRAGGIDSIKQWLMMKEPTWSPEQIVQHNDEMLGVFADDLRSAVEKQRS